MSHRKGTQSRNLAYFSTRQKFLFTEFFRSLAGVAPMRRVYIVTSDDNAAAAAKSLTALARKSEVQVKSFSTLGFQRVPVSFREIAHRLTDWIGPAHQDAILAVDMSWGLATNSAMANFEKWMVVAEDMVERTGLTVASLYNRRLLIDEQLFVALRGHPAVLTASGIVPNPPALPAALLTRGTLREQIDHWLGAISPELDRTPNPAPFHAAAPPPTNSPTCSGRNPRASRRRGTGCITPYVACDRPWARRRTRAERHNTCCATARVTS